MLNKSGLSYIWLYQNCISEKWLSNVVKMNLIDKFKQTWSTSVENSPKALHYRLYKKRVPFENYLEILKDKNLFLFVVSVPPITDYPLKLVGDKI
jgi:hypothetical protein